MLTGGFIAVIYDGLQIDSMCDNPSEFCCAKTTSPCTGEAIKFSGTWRSKLLYDSSKKSFISEKTTTAVVVFVLYAGRSFSVFIHQNINCDQYSYRTTENQIHDR